MAGPGKAFLHVILAKLLLFIIYVFLWKQNYKYNLCLLIIIFFQS